MEAVLAHTSRNADKKRALSELLKACVGLRVFGSSGHYGSAVAMRTVTRLSPVADG